MKPFITLGILSGVVALSGCDDVGMAESVAVAPSPEEQACLRDVSAETGSPEVVLLGSEFSQAGTYVRVGLGPNAAPWQCIAYSDGTTGGVQSLVDEGAA